MGSAAAEANLSVTLACEPPNNNLHHFIGRAVEVPVAGDTAHSSNPGRSLWTQQFAGTP